MTRDRTSPGEPARHQDTRRATEDSDRERALGEAASAAPDRRRRGPFRRAIRIAERAGLDVQAGRARIALPTLGGTRRFRQRRPGPERAALVLQGADPAPSDRRSGRTSTTCGGRLVAALEGYDQALPGLRRAGDRCYEAIALANRALVLAHQGSFAQAVPDLRRRRHPPGRIGESRLAAHVELNLGWLAARTGDIPSALARFDRADELFRQAGGTDPAALFDRCEASSLPVSRARPAALRSRRWNRPPTGFGLPRSRSPPAAVRGGAARGRHRRCLPGGAHGPPGLPSPEAPELRSARPLCLPPGAVSER